MYGPMVPTKLEATTPIEMPVCRRHVGYNSIACKLTAKKFIDAKHLIIIIMHVVANCQWLSARCTGRVGNEQEKKQKMRKESQQTCTQIKLNLD